MGGGWSRPLSLLHYHPQRAPELAQEAGLVWMGAENLISEGILTPKHPVRSNCYTDHTIPAPCK